jgi:hypothetical protein
VLWGAFVLLALFFAHLARAAFRASSLPSAADILLGPPKENEAKPDIPCFTIAKMAEELGIEGDKALQLLLECERQQALRKKGGR